MEKNMQLKPYAIPQEHLKGIKGGLNSQKHTKHNGAGYKHFFLHVNRPPWRYAVAAHTGV